MASVERDTNCPNPKEMPRRQKKDLPMNVPANPSTDARTTEVYVSIKFHSSTSEARDSLHASSCHNQRSYTVFFYIMLALFRCIVLKPGRQHVSIHGYTVMEQPVARNLFQSLAAGIVLVEPQQSSDNSLCSHPVASKTSQSGITCHKLQKRQTLAPNSKPKFDLKMKPFLASPNETIEGASQKLKLKMASVERWDTNCPNPKEMPRRQKKALPMNVPANPSTDARTTEVYVSIKFHSSTSEARDSLHASSCHNQRSYTVFFYIMLALRRYSHQSPEA